MTAAKAIVAIVIQVVGQVLALGLLTGNGRATLEIVAAALTAIAVYLTPNQPAPTP